MSIDPAIQSRLIVDLEPAVAVEFERHLSVQKNWYPHEYVPWSEGRTFAGPLNGDAWEAKDSKLTGIAQDSLVLNLMTEDNLPSYHTEIAIAMGRDGAWGNWIERWTAEENRHGIVMRDYLMATRGDSFILVVNHMDEDQFIQDHIDSLRIFGHGRTIALALSDQKRKLEHAFGRARVMSEPVGPEEQREHIQRLEAKFGIPVVSILDGERLADVVVAAYAESSAEVAHV